MEDSSDSPLSPPLVPEYYVDYARFSVNPFTFGIEFGILGFPASDALTANAIEPVVRIRMSPHHAYAMRDLLDRNLAGFEEQVGPFTVSSQFTGNREKPPEQ